MSGDKWAKIFQDNQSVGGVLGAAVGAVAGFAGTAAVLGLVELGLPGIADNVADRLNLPVDQATGEGVRVVLETAALAGAGAGAKLGHAADPHVRRFLRRFAPG
jgi:hypothetical protein